MTPLGTVTLVFPLDNATVTPPLGAGADKVTVQEELPGPATAPGEQLKLAGTRMPLRFTVVNWLWPFRVAVIVAVWLLPDPLVAAWVLPRVPLLAVNVALLWPAGTVTLWGTDRVPVLLARETVAALEAA